jgi:hypothetical protein
MDDYTPIYIVFRHQTGRAVLAETESGAEVWIPKSLIEDIDIPEPDTGPGDELIINVRDWFVEREVLI